MDKRGDQTLDDAKAIKTALAAQPDALDNAGELGDEFMLQAWYPEKSQIDIQKLFGSGFAESVIRLTAGKWHGPVLSGYGTHLVYVHGIIEPPPPEFTAVRDRVQQDWEDQRRETMNEQFYASLRDRYSIVIEDFSPESEKVAAR